MNNIASSVIEKIEKQTDNPLEYDDLVVAWNSLCEQSWTGNADESQFADVENAAIVALSDHPAAPRSGHIGYEIGQMLNSFDYPTYMVTSEGIVVAANMAAESELELDVGDDINSLPFNVENAIPLSDLIRQCMKGGKSERSDVVLNRAFGKDNDIVATLAISASVGRVSTALCFVITSKWRAKSAEILKKQFGLTDAETEILVTFVDGYSSKDIAKLRNRSHATIRTQFQSLLAKTGSRNQVELLRTTLSVSDFVDNIGVIADAVNHPYRRCAAILREGGRLVEVTLMGDLSGKPITTIAMPSVYTFSADFEQRLFDAGLCLISMCTPGCGRTDPAPKGQTRIECITNDMRAVFNQLKITSSVFLTNQTNPPILFALANQMPELVKHVVQVSSCAPLKYTSSHVSQSSWTTGILRASISHPAMKLVLLKGALKAWATLGTKQFLRLQLSSNPIDERFALLPENLKEFEHALRTTTRSGVTSAAEDLVLSFGDWSEEIKTLPMKITIIQGQEDQLYGIDPIRTLASQYSEKIDLIEIESAGFTLIQSHPAKFIKVLRSVI